MTQARPHLRFVCCLPARPDCVSDRHSARQSGFARMAPHGGEGQDIACTSIVPRHQPQEQLRAHVEISAGRASILEVVGGR